MFTFDKTKCSGCGACILACMDAHNPEPTNPAVQYRRLRRLEGLEQGRPRVRFEVLSCRHCQSALCIAACPTGAMHREGDFVRVDKTACVSCDSCAKACPFDAIVMEDAGPLKCPGCGERFCEKACPLEAVRWK